MDLRAGWACRRGGVALRAALLAGVAALGACQSGGAGKPATGGGSAAPADGWDLGTSLAGEPCRALPDPERSVTAEHVTVYSIRCGAGAGSVAGSLTVQPLGQGGTGDDQRRALAQAVPATRWSRETQQRLACQPGSWLDDTSLGDLQIARCTVRSGGWPYVILTSIYQGKLMLGDAVPSATPAVQAAMLRVSQDESGGPARPPTRPTSSDGKGGIAALEKALGPAATMGSGDLAAYEDLVQLARLYNSVENFAGAERAYLRALDIQTKALGAGHVGLADTLMALALEVSNQGRAEEAEAIFRRAEPLAQKSLDKSDQARLTSYLAFHAANSRNYRRAYLLAKDATEQRRLVAEELGFPTRQTQGVVGATRRPTGAAQTAVGDVAHSLYLQAAMALRLNVPAEADQAIAEAVQIVSQTPGLPRWWLPQFLMLQGEIAAKVGRPEKAESSFSRAVALRKALFGEGWPVAQAHMSLGRFLAEDGNYPKAIDAYRAAIALIADDDRQRSELRFDRLAPFLVAASAEAERLPGERERLMREMFIVAQLAREGVAGQTIARASARLAVDDPKLAALIRTQQDALRRRDTLQMELAAETGRPADRRDRGREQELQKNLLEANQKADALDADIEKASPGFSRLSRAKPLAAPDLAKQLAGDEALITFFFGRETSFAMLLRRDGLTVQKLDITEKTLADSVAELRKAVTVRLGSVEPFDLALSHRLYSQLLGPFAEKLKDINHLVFVPQGALTALPPALLVSAPPTPGDYAGAAWLMRRHAISVAPSIRAFADMRALKAKASAPRPFIGFGNPGFSGAALAARPGQPPRTGLDALAGTCRDGGPLDPALLRALAPLPDTADELRSIARTLGAGGDSLFLGGAANEQTVRAQALDQYRIVYFATHGLLPGELRCQSEPGLALSPPAVKPGTTAQDGLLDASEIAALNLNADLVVLSACNTGGGSGRLGGEALSGLAEAFFNAGARSLLVTHWQVPSAPTVKLTTGLFETLGPKMSGGIAQALRQSQTTLAATPATAHPFYWAAFTLVGDGGTAAPVRSASRLAPHADLAYDVLQTGSSGPHPSRQGVLR